MGVTARSVSQPLQTADPARDATDVDPDAGVAVVLIDHRPLMRQCLASWLVDHWPGLRMTPIDTVDAFFDDPSLALGSDLVVLSIAATPAASVEILPCIDRLVSDAARVPLVILSDRDEIEEVAQAIQHGVRGYIPTCLELNEAAEALRFIHAGGTFVPAGAILRSVQHDRPRPGSRSIGGTPFDSLTPREMEVLIHLSQGKPNKVIAHELEISESTVKVFVRRILTKLNAINRTEVAYLARSRLDHLPELAQSG